MMAGTGKKSFSYFVQLEQQHTHIRTYVRGHVTRT
jgi:hypothetical protein